MTGSSKTICWLDPLYGHVCHDESISILIKSPIVQRLRHVRLSNIDSLDLPSISNLSRYEHVLGVAYLARNASIRHKLTHLESLAFDSAALLHDWAITAFGHLIEEALQYVGTAFNHETRLAQLATTETSEDVGGITDRQILFGRGVGLVQWAQRVTGSARERDCLVSLVAEMVRGRGKLGPIISGTIDLDNIDNVVRMAFHMGLDVDPSLPLRLAKAIYDVDEATNEPRFAADAKVDVSSWLEIRRQVYELLMLSEQDFAGKTMVIYASTLAYNAGDFQEADWALTDEQFLHRVSNSTSEEARQTIQRWLCGELWEMSPLSWFSGQRPSYKELMRFSEELSGKLERKCFAYGIKDKRARALSVFFGDEDRVLLGEDSDSWLFGFGSPLRRPLSNKECEQAWSLAEQHLGRKFLSIVGHDVPSGAAGWLI